MDYHIKNDIISTTRTPRIISTTKKEGRRLNNKIQQNNNLLLESQLIAHKNIIW